MTISNLGAPGSEQGAIGFAAFQAGALGNTLDGRLTITVPEAGHLLGLGRGAAYAAARRGEIPTLRFAGRLVVPVPALLDLVGISSAAYTSMPGACDGARVGSESGASA